MLRILGICLYFDAAVATEIYTLSLHDALPICAPALHRLNRAEYANAIRDLLGLDVDVSTLLPPDDSTAGFEDRKSTRLNSSHGYISYAVFCLKKKKLLVNNRKTGFTATRRCPT